MTFKHTSEVYNAGYAWPEYSISLEYRYWRFREEHFKTEAEFPVHGINFAGDLFNLPKIEDVRKNAI